MTISADAHIKPGSAASVYACGEGDGRFFSVHIRPKADQFSHISLILPRSASQEQADAIADAINAAVAVPVRSEAESALSDEAREAV